jgi:multidrug efflux system membrane fusion protein
LQAALRQAQADLAKDRAALNQARAALARDQTQAQTARLEAQRYRTLLDKGVVTKEQYDQMETNAQALEASLKADQAAITSAEETIRAQEAAVQTAQLRLGYCTIRAPVSGLTGSVLVHAGNVVKVDDPTLVVINQIQPCYVVFSVPQAHLDEIMTDRAKGKLEMTATLPNMSGKSAQGVLTFVNNTVDPATGTIELKGTFSNRRSLLWPGQFVNVVLTLAFQPNAMVVPSQAVQTGQSGQYVFVVKSNRTVESRPVVVNRTVASKSVISRGLRVGEQVVTDGQLRLSPGAKVEIQEGASPAGGQGSAP